MVARWLKLSWINSVERVLAFITAREQGYGAEIAKAFDTDLSPVQKQLERMDNHNQLWMFGDCLNFLEK